MQLTEVKQMYPPIFALTPKYRKDDLMIQDIYPHKFHNQYRTVTPASSDFFLKFREGKVLVRQSGNSISLPKLNMLEDEPSDATYLFSADDMPIFLLNNLDKKPEGFEYTDIHWLYNADVPWIPLAVATGHHLNTWYEDNKYCGRCGRPMIHHPELRALKCSCGNLQFPKIAPVILAAIVNNGRIVATRYKDRPYKGYALNAGFVEIGESLEQAIRREVEEEVGLKVAQTHYFASQPWGQTGIVMAGYFVEIDGDDTITMDTDELSEALWIEREKLPPQTNKMSLTARMFEAFRLKEVDYD